MSPVTLYRVANWAYRHGIPWVPRWLDLLNRLCFACWLPHSAKLGRRLVLGYGGLAVVIHDRAEIGDDVHIDQGVTVGGDAVRAGVPKIGNRVYIGAGAKLLGPITIGDGCIIGANAVVNRDVPPQSIAVGVPARVTRTGIDIDGHLYHRRTKGP